MGILDARADDLQTAALNSYVAPAQPEPGIFKGAAKGAGMYFMRGLAETGRAVDLLGAVGPIAADAITGGTARQDAYFREHDEIFNRAVDYWTPRPGEVGAAGQVVGSLAAGLTQFAASPALLVGTQMLGTGEDLTRQGVDSGAALVAGDIQGLATAAGIALPIFGKTLGQRMAAGALGNLATNVPAAAGTRAVLNAAGAPQAVADQFNPFDANARIVDTLLGLAFGAKAHVDATFTAGQRDAILTANAARHLESVAPADAAPEQRTAAVDALRTAVEQMARGEAVSAPDVALARPDGDLSAVVGDYLPAHDQIKPPELQAGAVEPAPAATPGEAAATKPAPQFPPDLRLPSGDFDPATGEPRTVSAAEHVAAAQAEAEHIKSTAQGFADTAAACLLGIA